MIVSIIVDQNQVMIDNVKLAIDCSSLADKCRAVHWHTDKGFIEPLEPRFARPEDIITDTKFFDHILQAYVFKKMILENQGTFESEAIVHEDFNPDVILETLQRMEDQLYELQ